MVGVPGRSQGCNTCIQRKVKCDQENPQCGPCLKSGRLCMGYKRRVGFVFSDKMRVDQQNGQSKESTTADSAITHQGRWRKTQKVSPRSIASYQRLPRQVSSGTAMRQQFHYLFLDHHIPREAMVAGAGCGVPSTAWMLELQGMEIHSPALQAAVTAYSTARVGRLNRDDALVRESRVIYLKGLQDMRKAIVHPKMRLSDETLAACLGFATYELTECPPDVETSYVVHYRAAQTLLELRGPKARTSPLGHSVFINLRAETVTRRLMDHQETFFAREEWIHQPWQSLVKSPTDEVTDVLVGLLSAYQAWDRAELGVLGGPEANLGALRAVIKRTSALDRRLQELNEQFKASMPGPTYWPEISRVEDHAENAATAQLFPTSLFFPAFVVAQFATTYWSASMAMNYLAMRCYDKMLEIDPPATGRTCSPFEAKSLEHRQIWESMVWNICQSVEYFLQPQMGNFGHMNGLMLVAGCLSVLRNEPGTWPRELRWCADIIARVKVMCNMPPIEIRP